MDIAVPTLGESVSEATVAQWLKQPGDAVEADEPVAELETDKVTLEVNAPAKGTLAEQLVGEGDTVEVGTVIGRVAQGAGAAAAPAAAAAKESAPAPAKEQAAPAAGGGEQVDVPVPTLGESVSEATVAQWLKQPGDTVTVDEPIVELETDKVTLEVNAPADGTLAEQLAGEGDTVEVGAILGRISKGAAPAKAEAPAAREAAPEPAKEPAPAAAEAAPTATAPAGGPSGGLDPNRAPRTNGSVTREDLMAFLSEGPGSVRPEDLSPSVRVAVQEYNVDPSRIPGSGPGGRLTKEDVVAFAEGRVQPLAPPEGVSAPAAKAGAEAPKAEGAAAPAAKAPAAKAAEAKAPGAGEKREERVKMSRLRQTIAKRLKEAQNTAAMLTTFNEIDMTAVNQLRAEYREQFEKVHGVRLGMTCFFAKAVVQALQELPAVNARIEGDEIVYNHYYDIGMAVSTPQGLMVPVVRDVDRKSMAEIEGSLRELAKKGRDGKLKMEDLQGATFSMTNGGVFGSLLSTPILNTPQSGILGMHKIQDRPMAVDGEVKIRPMMYVALSYDHRVIDGREAVTFLVRVKECLEDPARLLLQT
nr:2-oxoglutarate dehydrogenase complex dihydrolipoyllysine-residue succinyltransferase [Ferruginivarius sediminum]